MSEGIESQRNDCSSCPMLINVNQALNCCLFTSFLFLQVFPTLVVKFSMIEVLPFLWFIRLAHFGDGNLYIRTLLRVYFPFLNDYTSLLKLSLWCVVKLRKIIIIKHLPTQKFKLSTLNHLLMIITPFCKMNLNWNQKIISYSN